MKIVFVGYPRCSPWSLIGAYEILKKATNMAKLYPEYANVKTIPELHIVNTESEQHIDCDYGISINCTKSLEEYSADLIIIPGYSGEFTNILSNKSKLINWLSEQYQNGSEIATICTGAFFLAESGILNGKKATTHWMASDIFCKRYKNIELESEKLIIDQNGLYMSGGATAFQDLMIYLVEKFMSKKLAFDLAKILLIDPKRDVQSSYSLFWGQKQHNNEAIKKAQDYIERNIESKIMLSELISVANMSQRSFIRHFKKATGNTPYQYIQRVKVEAAKSMIESQQYQIDEIAFQLGYEDTNAFRGVFKKNTGISPYKYKSRYVS